MARTEFGNVSKNGYPERRFNQTECREHLSELHYLYGSIRFFFLRKRLSPGLKLSAANQRAIRQASTTMEQPSDMGRYRGPCDFRDDDRLVLSSVVRSKCLGV